MFLSGPFNPLISFADDHKEDPLCEGARWWECPTFWTSPVESWLQGAVSNDDKGLDWGTSFTSGKSKSPGVFIGKDLYLIIYKDVHTDPIADAVKATAEQYGLPPDRMFLILGGDLTPIMDRAPTMRIEDATRIYNQMIATYNDRKDSADLEADIRTKITPREIFADGDLDNCIIRNDGACADVLCQYQIRRHKSGVFFAND